MTEHKREHISNELKDQTWSRDYDNQFMATCIACKTTTINSRNCEYDHITPVSKGGKSTLDNLQAICKSCNRKKATKTIRFTPDQTQINLDEMLALSLNTVMLPPDRGPAMVPDHIPYESIASKPNPYSIMAKVFEEFHTYFHVRAHIRGGYGYHGESGEDLYTRYRLIIDDINEGKEPDVNMMQSLLCQFRNSEAWLGKDFDDYNHYEKSKFAQLDAKWMKAKQEYYSTKK